MKVSEQISELQTILEASGDKEIVYESNRHRYDGAKIVEHNNQVILSMFGKTEIK